MSRASKLAIWAVAPAIWAGPLRSVPAAAPGHQGEGPASTDISSSSPVFHTPAWTEVAAGPDDVLVGIKNVLARFPNPNAPGLIITPNNPVNPDVMQPTEKVAADRWIGPAAVAQVCPTTPRTEQSCVFDNLTVRYDQMQGRFIVLFTATDTGIVGNQVTQPRKASWLLAVSRYAGLTGPSGTGAFSQPVPAPLAGDAAWTLYGLDGAGNINALPGISGSAARFDCAPGAIARATTPFTAPAAVCYFPSSARLGLDNDNIIIASAVLNDNFAFDPNAAAGPNTRNSAYAGTRLRVIKKTALYSGRPLAAGNQFAAGGFADRAGGDYYDLFTNPAGNGVPVTSVPPLPYTYIPNAAVPLTPAFFEPQHLRGRPMASFSNSPFGPGQSNSQSYLVGATLGQQNTIMVQAIRNIYPNPGQYAALGITPSTGTIPFYPILQGGTADAVDGAAVSGVPQTAFGGFFRNPNLVSQAAQRNNQPAPALYVGDNRPRRLIFREGHLYETHVGEPLTSAAGPSSVFYNIITKGTANPALSGAAGIVPVDVFSTSWPIPQAYAPMFDVPANVVRAGSVSPVNLFPYLEKLFVGTTYPPLSPNAPFGREALSGAPITGPRGEDICASGARTGEAWPSLFDIRCGEEAYDNPTIVRDYGSGAPFTTNGLAGGPPALRSPFGFSGGASTDPNDLGLWAGGQYARRRIAGAGAWGTYVAHYSLTFPVRDPYGNSTVPFSDVLPTHPAFPYIKIAAQTNLVRNEGATFEADALVSRNDVAGWVVRAQMDEAAITNYLNATGGVNPSFADVPTSDTNWRYVETMYRRGYTKACSEAPRNFCPGSPVTRGDMAVFIIRAKMGNVFPSVSSGCLASRPLASCSNRNDNFGLYVPATPYFSDNPEPSPDAPNDLYPYVQLIRSLRIDNGADPGTVREGEQFPTGGTFGPDQPLTRGDAIQFIVRAFFP